MKINQTPIDRALRGILGVAIVATPVMGLDTLPYNWLGLIPWATAIVGWCPIYHLFGLSTVTEKSYQHGHPNADVRHPEPTEAHAA